MAARRERERRRPPSERRYQFGTPEAAEAEELNGAPEAEAEATAAPSAPPARRATAPPPATRGSAVTKPTNRPFSSYRAEYAYVTSDLRRVAIVIGSLLIALILLSLVLPR
jgi:hypothetical protein